jgi:tRNA(Ile)-lysidine synthase
MLTEDILIKSLKSFFKKNFKNNRPILLGYSGGYDSKALLFLLLKMKELIPFELHLAHVDHGWRSESFEQARMLQKEALDQNLCFHLKTLPKINGSNLEEKCRHLRFSFFQELFLKYSYQALILAHQRDDVSETVLKRILEGADLFSIKAMEEVSSHNDMVIWRPLLAFSKKDLMEVLQKNKLEAIDDRTNYDPKYQRSKMRTEIIPDLSKKFGKEVSYNLYLASQRSLEMNQYLMKKTNEFFNKKVEGPFGLFLDFSAFLHLEEIEKRFLLKRLGTYLNLDLSRSTIERILTFLATSFSLSIKGCKIITYKNKLFFLKQAFSLNINALPLKEGINFYENWEIEVIKTQDKGENSSWVDLWKGNSTIYLPKEKYDLVPSSKNLKYFNKSLSGWFLENKIPSFFRFCFPVIFKGDKMAHEFLSGKSRIKDNSSEFYKISFKLNCLS